eukprot:TRINITY_DN335_c0_g1_i1.p1 TRINITY_DN335_c0_g1~~TRINITY_DN335_c0_g1_i1.p1  ORF type:complete len:324 (+),score=54.17 TRINITY_DN335_c0_g1_i1:381-1352(+)
MAAAAGILSGVSTGGMISQAASAQSSMSGMARRVSDPGSSFNCGSVSSYSPVTDSAVGFRTACSVAVSSGSFGGGQASKPPRARRNSQSFLFGESAAELSRIAGESESLMEDGKKGMSRQRRNSWSMEVADPQENYRDSFGNECTVEKQARRDLEKTSDYQRLMVELKVVKERMNGLVTQERYEDCQELVDGLNLLEFRKRVMEMSSKPRINFRVGDVIVHRRYGYRGVVYGHDPECSAPDEWQQAMKIDLLPEGRQQPFYHVLVDTRDRPGGMSTYVAQENIVIQKGARPVLHPWIDKFFVGFHDGAYIPGAKLRQVYPHDW